MTGEINEAQTSVVALRRFWIGSPSCDNPLQKLNRHRTKKMAYLWLLLNTEMHAWNVWCWSDFGGTTRPSYSLLELALWSNYTVLVFF